MPGIKDQIKFGTDGWRGVISDNFTFENVRIVAQAMADWVNRDLKVKPGQLRKRVAVGYDTRFLSAEYAEIVACVLAANGIEVHLSDRSIPTPALSYGVVNLKGVCGVMITASHNPGKFNGIKIKTDKGGGAANDITKKVEANLGLNLVKTIDVKKAKAQKSVIMHDYTKSYIAFLRKYLDLKTIKSARFKILTDVMHGSGGRLMEEILKGTKLRLTLTREDVNPIFDGLKPEPIAEYVAGSLQRVKKEKFDIGLILDGDADRIGAIAPGGEFVNPQRILGLIILHLYRNRGRRGGIVKTICGTTMLDNIARKLKLKLHETPVGFKYISDLMVSERVIAGGEEAGGVGVQDYIPERDGSLAGLLLVEMMVYNKKNLKQLLAEMEKEFGRYYYLRSDAHLGDKPADLSKFKAVSAILGKKVVDRKDYDGLKLICEDESWVMWRPSGTEPLVRVYAEAKSLKRAQELIKFGETAF